MTSNEKDIASFLEKDDVVLYFDVRQNDFVKALVVCVHRDDRTHTILLKQPQKSYKLRQRDCLYMRKKVHY